MRSALCIGRYINKVHLHSHFINIVNVIVIIIFSIAVFIINHSFLQTESIAPNLKIQTPIVTQNVIHPSIHKFQPTGSNPLYSKFSRPLRSTWSFRPIACRIQRRPDTWCANVGQGSPSWRTGLWLDNRRTHTSALIGQFLELYEY